MARNFGEGDQTTAIVLERFGDSDSFTLLVAGKPLGSSRLAGSQPVKIAIRFGPVEAEQQLSVSPITIGDKPGFIKSGAAFAELLPRPAVDSHGPQINPSREAAIDRLSIGRLAKNDVVLELGSMGKPMEAMRSCIVELKTHWGIDVARHATLTKHASPTGQPSAWLQSSDYPADLIAKGKQGIVSFRLMVGIDGMPTSCHIQRSTRPQSFDDVVCKALMKRAKFTPALDAQGKPIASYFLSSVQFSMSS